MSKQINNNDYSKSRAKHFDDWDDSDTRENVKSKKIAIQRARKNAAERKFFAYCNVEEA